MVKKITIEQLAHITKRGFDEVDKRFADVDKRLGEGEKRFQKIEHTMKEGFEMVLDEVRGLRDDMKIDQQADRMIHGDLNERIVVLEKDMKSVKEKVRI